MLNAILLIIFPLMNFNPYDYFVTANLCMLIPSPFPPIALFSGNHESVLYKLLGFFLF